MKKSSFFKRVLAAFAAFFLLSEASFAMQKLSILVDKSDNILFVKEGRDVLKTYVVSTGSNNSTPTGKFKIVNKVKNPTWYKDGKVIPFDSKDNHLGTRWMGFDLKSYGIHGTVEPEKLGKQVSAGCIRMKNQEVEELFELIPTGTVVTVQN